MRHQHCSAMYREMVYGANGGANWATRRSTAHVQDRPNCAKDASTYGLLVQAVEFAMSEHCMPRRRRPCASWMACRLR
jgi:hypothetical protein